MRDGGGKGGFELCGWKGKWVRSRDVNANSELDRYSFIAGRPLIWYSQSNNRYGTERNRD